MASLSVDASAAPAPARVPRSRPRAEPRTRARPRRRVVSSGVGWILVFAVLLAGIVAVNVAVLQANIRLDRLGQQRANLRSENAVLASQLSAAAAGPRIAGLAARRFGLVQASAQDTTYVELAR